MIVLRGIFGIRRGFAQVASGCYAVESKRLKAFPYWLYMAAAVASTSSPPLDLACAKSAGKAVVIAPRDQRLSIPHSGIIALVGDF